MLKKLILLIIFSLTFLFREKLRKLWKVEKGSVYPVIQSRIIPSTIHIPARMKKG